MDFRCSRKPCKYFNEGRGECYMGSNCFYKHAYADGRPASPRAPRRRRRQDESGELESVLDLLLSDFIEARAERVGDLDMDELHDMVVFSELLDGVDAFDPFEL